ncbi:acyltransferase [Arcanobacterium haemolyticum]|uniref:Phospholipid/glycerol acyltransferase n=1 Tax=Arcanobacterium haemolyticum (strain ATCC 9345 / DSM 20595 / CCM 5947 / CCUG 17215 / LMG 16163 / NBRC 15585 / NCTC 8452 / 11018) TaxID=644284 RepID=D7BLE0_ARCHD|nr:1-acyl-sn-glycerol-3-phosphate acyltransferase [Arcanobacterium haemolyticum]ADH93470.1 phospholipid/glycerol acyltransferase [Arcanobacterium haemolyticum DSM 20595]QCX47459.1 acyltransferase [Arcanobacterium haemolyticum]SQH27516.1 1-acylglycerol-3-phosphate O-acyltransferases [Arcanobacterium haemolyticum]
MSFKRFISRTFQKFSRWQMDVEPLPPKAILIGAPHTSNWDAVYMIVAFWDVGRDLRFLVKNSIINGPIGPIARAVGGVGVDRNSNHGLVQSIAEQARKASDFTLCVTPKGTRGRREFWKSGFYHMAYEAGIPVVFGFVDSTTKRYGWKGSMMLTGNMEEDMDKIRAFYADKVGVKPELTCVPRLRNESPIEETRS